MDAFALKPLSASGRDVWLWPAAGAEDGSLPLVVVPAGEDAPAELEHILPLVAAAVQQGRCRPCRLACFASTDWNRDYSPWAAPALFGKDGPFPGGGPETLAWLKTQLLPALAEGAPPPTPENTAILGYSLAGLFALWAFYESGLFGRAASCSGSLWFDGWADYQAGRSAPANSRVYLSLGDKEEQARNPRMAAVGEATRHTAAALQADPHVAESTLEWHPGGHFRDVPQRMAQGLLWLLRP